MKRTESEKDRASYEEAKAQLLGDIVPAETPVSCCLTRCFKCCLFYTFCCCCCYSKEKLNTKANYILRFQKWMVVSLIWYSLPYFQSKSNYDLSVVKLLMKLYAHQPDAIMQLETQCRINPDFGSPFRNDLEFFIPQICSFLLKGDLGYFQHDQLLNLILVASQIDFNFSHRVWFFMQANKNQEQTCSSKVIHCLKQVSMHQETKEIMYLANGKDLVGLLLQLQMITLYPKALQFVRKDHKLRNKIQVPSEQHREDQMYRIVKTKEMILMYNCGQYNYDIEICAQDLILPTFELQSVGGLDEDLPLFKSQSDHLKLDKLYAFLSTPRFIRCLTDISRKLSLIQAPNEEKRGQLVQEVRRINCALPAAVYIPFVNNSSRNYAVLHIPISEVRVFQTKERSPIMLCIEVYRPDEMNLYVERPEKNQKNQKRKSIIEKVSNKIKSSNSNENMSSIETDADQKASNPQFIRKNKQKRHELVSDVELDSEIQEPFSINNASNTQQSQISCPELLQPTFETEGSESSDSSELSSDGLLLIEEEVKHGFTYKELDIKQLYDQYQQSVPLKRQGETSREQERRVRLKSPFGHLRSWRLIRVLVKANDDVRQEQFAMQLISQVQQIFQLKKLKLWLRTYEILATGPDCGLIEFVQDTKSLDEIHRSHGTLVDYFDAKFGRKNTKTYQKAQKNFMQSLAAYSLVCYVLQIKDRHNQNIMLDEQGHILHIDFGFLLSNSPGKGLKFEKAPFKLTQEFIQILGDHVKDFRKLMAAGFLALQEHADKILVLVEMMMMGHNDLKCFEKGEETVRIMKNNLFPDGHSLSKEEAQTYVNWLVDSSLDNWRTIWYDRVQYCCQGIV